MSGNRPIPNRLIVAGALLLSSLLLVVPASMHAQTPAPAKPAPAKPAPAKPVPAAKPAVVTNTTAAKPVAATPAKPAATVAAPAATARPAVVMNPNAARPGTVATPARNNMALPANNASANQVVQPAASRAVATPVPGRSNAAIPGVTTVGGQSAAAGVNSYASGGQRGAVVVPGAGSFLWGDWTLVAYGCYRTGGGTRVLCDFDATKQNGVQANANAMWQGLNMVDPSGRVTIRHSTFFLGDDGSQFETGYISPTPVRMFMEYDDVNPAVTTVTLVQGQQRVQGVNIMAVDPNAPPGSIPARAAAQSDQAAQAGAPASGNPMDKAQQGLNNVNNQINNANDQKTKAKGLWDQLKSTVQSTKH